MFGNRYGQRRQEHLVHVRTGVFSERDPLGHQRWEGSCSTRDVGEPLDEQEREPEGRGSQAGDGDDANDLVLPLIAIQGGDDTQDRGEDNGHKDSDEGQLERDREGCGNHVGDLDSGEGGSEVTVDQAQEIVPEPLEKWIVEVVGDSVLLEGV